MKTRSKRQHVHSHILTAWTLILTLLLAAPAVTPAVAAGAGPLARDMTKVNPSDMETTTPASLTADDEATIRDLIREAQYQFTWQVSDGVWAYRAPNWVHDLAVSLAADGFHAARYSAAGEPLWDLSLSLAAYGEQTFPAIIGEDGLVGNRERVEYHWSQDVVEWYTNGSAGIEHGLTLAAPPPGADSSKVELTFALGGSLTPELDASGRTLRLKEASGQTVLLYDQFVVYDAAGRSLPGRMRLTGNLQSAKLQLIIDVTGATYPLTVDPLLHGEATQLTASDAESLDHFGSSVAISGDTVVVGAWGEDGAGGNERGAAYVFERNHNPANPTSPLADNWGEVTKLTASSVSNHAYFGWSVAISGDTALIGAYGVGSGQGAAYVYVLQPLREITVSPASLDFGDHELGSLFLVKVISITNDGGGDLHITGVSLTGADATEFAIRSDSGEATLTPGDTRTVGISFVPSSEGAKTATLSITSDDSDEPTVNVALSGNAVLDTGGWYVFLPLVVNHH